ncbi:MAG: SPASM domain-containing protein [Candidatus Omnitrophica bacterium]|nr:SPASM domain-containing protein [Candidatus Omnitrophota bacterium]
MVLEKKLLPYSLDSLQEETKQIRLKAQQIVKNRKIKIDNFFLRAINPKENISSKCRYPWQHFKVSLSGNVKICCFSSAVAGNIFKQSVEEIWNGEVYRIYRRTVNTKSPFPECSVCPVKNPHYFSTNKRNTKIPIIFSRDAKGTKIYS